MEIGSTKVLSSSIKLIKAYLPFPKLWQEIPYSYQTCSRPRSFSRMNDVVTKKRSRMLQGTVKMLVFLKNREKLSGSKEDPSSSDGGGKSDELNESDEMGEMDREMDGDSCDATRTSEGKEAAAVDLGVI